MIIFNTKGGLGNQLFQYAFGRYLSLKYKQQLYLDITFYNNTTQHRSYGLNKFSIEEGVIVTADFSKFKWLKNPFVRRIVSYLPSIFSVYIERRVSPFYSTLLEQDRGYFDGYWQCEQYFDEIRPVILKEISLKPAQRSIDPMIDLIGTSTSVSIHIRKTDYLNSENKGLYAECTAGYYTRAMEVLSLKFNNPHFFIFSDDYTWVKNNIVFNHTHTFMDASNEPEEDLHLMRLCNHNIIANSTFSWWGAWLNSNPDKVVIAPERWFFDDEKFKNNVVPSGWLKVRNDGR